MFPVAFQLLLTVSLLCLMTLGIFMSSGPSHCSVPMASSRKHCSSSRVERVCQNGKRTPKTVKHYPYGVKAGCCVTQRLPLSSQVRTGSLTFFFVTSLPFPFHVPVLGRCPTGLATNESGTRRTSANFKRRPISMLQKQP